MPLSITAFRIEQPAEIGLWTGCLDTAFELAQLGLKCSSLDEKDKFYRAALNRLYYACFHYSKYYATEVHVLNSGQLIYDPNTGEMHKKLIHWFYEHGFTSLNHSLEFVYQGRIASDYNKELKEKRFNYKNNPEDACLNAVFATKDVFKRIQELIRAQA